MPKIYIQFVPNKKRNNQSLYLNIDLFTNIKFVGVVSLFGNGLLRANAAQLQKIVNNTRYSNGLEINYKHNKKIKHSFS